MTVVLLLHWVFEIKSWRWYLLTLEVGRMHNKIFQKVEVVGLRTLATVCYVPVSYYFTLPNETHDLNIVIGSVQVDFVAAVLNHFRIWCKSALCHSRAAAVRILPQWSVGPVVFFSLRFSCYRVKMCVGTAWLYCRILTSNGETFGPTEFICGSFSVLNNS